MQARLLNISRQENVIEIMNNIGVDYRGVNIMAPKSQLRVIRLDGIPSLTANILKQDMLSLGGDVFVPKEALLKKKKITCLVTGTDYQIKGLLKKLKKQPYSLNQVGDLIKQVFKNFSKKKFKIPVPGKNININDPLVMGIINVTPDSFSGDGLAKNTEFEEAVLKRAQQMISEGAEILDIGGESTRPGSKKVNEKEELNRVIPAVKAIRRNFPKVRISVDTRKSAVAEKAIKEGACIINDVSALKSNQMAVLAAKEKVGVVLMHMKGIPANMQKKPYYKDTITEIYGFLQKRVDRALKFGIDRNRLIIDVGIGFGKRLEDNLKLIKYLYEFKSMGLPILIGTSRKSFIGKVLKGKAPFDRITGTVASLVVSIINGASIVRVHDVKQAKQAIALTKAINGV